ncbi:MAG: hypothetical protein ACKVQA_20050 [Burkholderiales bacterium]
MKTLLTALLLLTTVCTWAAGTVIGSWRLVEAASSQNWVETDLPRVVSFNGNRFKLEAPLQERHGVVQRFEQVWERDRG